MPKSRDADILLLVAVADPVRLAILRQLSTDGPTCAGALERCCVDLSQPTISHHLKLLHESGWVDRQRRGRHVWYAIDADAAMRFERIAVGIHPSRTRSDETTSPLPGPRRERPPATPEWRQW